MLPLFALALLGAAPDSPADRLIPPAIDAAGVSHVRLIPAESGEILRARAEVRIEETRQLLELAERYREGVKMWVNAGDAAGMEAIEAEVKVVTARAALRQAELDRRAAEEVIAAANGRGARVQHGRAAQREAAGHRLRAVEEQAQAARAQLDAAERHVAALERLVEDGEATEAEATAARDKLRQARLKRHAVQMEVNAVEAAVRTYRTASLLITNARPERERPARGDGETERLRAEVAELKAEIERLRAGDAAE